MPKKKLTPIDAGIPREWRDTFDILSGEGGYQFVSILKECKESEVKEAILKAKELR